MFYKFDDAAPIMEEIEILRMRLQLCHTSVNYALLFNEYSRYNYLKNNYKEVGTTRIEANSVCGDCVTSPTYYLLGTFFIAVT